MSLFSHVSTSSPRYLLRITVLSRLFQKYLSGAGRTFLEIGPGRGDISSYLGSHPAISDGMVVDRSEKAAALLRQRLRSGKVTRIMCGDLLDIDGMGGFDYVFSFEVLEHIEDDLEFMRRVNRLTARSGLWFISVPAYMRKWQIQDEFSGHVRRYEETELRDKLAKAGFTIAEISDYGFPLTSLMRPFRDRYYRPEKESSKLQRTLDSGVEKKLFTGRKPWLMLLLLSPFILLQNIFSGMRMGDGFIVVARKND